MGMESRNTATTEGRNGTMNDDTIRIFNGDGDEVHAESAKSTARRSSTRGKAHQVQLIAALRRLFPTPQKGVHARLNGSTFDHRGAWVGFVSKMSADNPLGVGW